MRLSVKYWLCQYCQAAVQSLVAKCAFKEGINTGIRQKTQSCDPVHANQLQTLIVPSEKKMVFQGSQTDLVSLIIFTHFRDIFIKQLI